MTVAGLALAMKVLALVAVLVLLAGCASPPDAPSAPTSSTAPSAPACGGHRHATFAVILPTGANSSLEVLDLAAPRHGNGHAYYQLGLAPGMDLAVHMHQVGPEAGNASLQATQMHYESSGACATVARSLAAVDVNASASSVSVGGRHNSTGAWSVTAANPLAIHLQRGQPAADGSCAWGWSPVDVVAGLAHAVADGESFLAVLGPASPGQVAAFQASLPPPMARPRDC
jgi:hypothetical protein